MKTIALTAIALSALTVLPSKALAVELFDDIDLTDEMAMEAGMTPVELVPFHNMKNVVSNNINAAGIARAIQSNRLVIAVNKKASGAGSQTLKMYENGKEILETKISTGTEIRVTSKSGKSYITTTPLGFFRPASVYRDYHSYTWDAPMPNAVFFIGGIAIHATGQSNYKFLGSRASGGCVRTTLADSKVIREKVMETGRGQDFRIVNEGRGRNRVVSNTVKVDGIARFSGEMTNSKVDSWDTVIVVYQ
jgi:lipoprotein-anchoring transpeptidase ErfK/SrfK